MAKVSQSLDPEFIRHLLSQGPQGCSPEFVRFDVRDIGAKRALQASELRAGLARDMTHSQRKTATGS